MYILTMYDGSEVEEMQFDDFDDALRTASRIWNALDAPRQRAYTSLRKNGCFAIFSEDNPPDKDDIVWDAFDIARREGTYRFTLDEHGEVI